MYQGSYRSGKTGKSQGICLVKESQGKPYNLKTVLEKSGKMNQFLLIIFHKMCLFFLQMRVCTSFLSFASVDVQMIRYAMHWHSSFSLRLKFHLARLDSTRHIRRVEPMHFGCVELVEEHSSTRSTSSSRLARLARQSRTCRVESSQVEFEPY